jgi:hypothetical protein
MGLIVLVLVLGFFNWALSPESARPAARSQLPGAKSQKEFPILLIIYQYGSQLSKFEIKQ